MTLSICFLESTYTAEKIIFGACYIPHQSPITVYDKHCESALDILDKNPFDKLLFLGDYNLFHASRKNDDQGVLLDARVFMPNFEYTLVSSIAANFGAYNLH